MTNNVPLSYPKILIIGLFLSNENKNKIARSASDQLAEVLEANQYQVIRSSYFVDRIKRMIDTASTIIFKRDQYDIAIVPLYNGSNSFIWQDVSVRILKFLKKKTILILHGGAIPQKMNENPGKYISSITRANIVVCPSNYIVNALEEHGIQSLLIENVLQLKDYKEQFKKHFRPKLVWMRTFEDVYNPLMAVRAFALLQKKYPEAKMVMAGHDKGMLQQTIHLAKELNVFDSIEFPGYISKEQKNQFAADFDFYICTNQIDNAPVSLVEMMAMGLPVITVDSGGIPFMVTDGHNGMMVKYNDEQAMFEKIDSIISDSRLGLEIVANAKAYAMQFGEKPVLKKWEHVFEML